MKNYKLWLVAAFFVAYGIVLGACYMKYSNQNITLTFGVFAGSYWDVPNGDSYRIYEDAIERFEKKHPNVKVNFTSGIQKDDYSEWLSKAAIKGEAPDVFVTLGEDFTTFSEAGLLTNLDNFILKDENFTLDDYYPTSLQAGMYEGVQYALPFESVPTLMFVNKTLLNQEGIELPDNDWTWEDFYRICEQVTKDKNGDGKLDQFGVYGYDWKTAVFSNGETLFDKSGSHANINSDPVIEAVEFTKSLVELNQNNAVTSQDFDKGNVAFCPMQFSQYRAYMPYPWRVKKYSTFEWDCIALPAGPNGDNVSQINTLSIGISSKSRNKNYAWEFLKMLTYDETTQRNIFTYSQGVATVKAVNESEEVIATMMQDTPGNSQFEMRILSDVMEHGIIQTRFSKYDDVISMMDNDIYRVINDVEGDITNEMNSLQRKIDVYLKE